MKSKATGLVYIFTGDGKGKTSAALGVAMRAVGQGRRAAMVQWYKEKRWQIGEHNLPELLKKPLFEIYPMGQGFYKLPTDHATKDEHQYVARKALKLAKKLLTDYVIPRSESTSDVGISAGRLPRPDFIGTRNDKLFLLVLDEALNAVHDGLIELDDLIDLISKRGHAHIILTGRNAPKKLIELADLVTEMKNVKHPFDSGKKAVLGLDY